MDTQTFDRIKQLHQKYAPNEVDFAAVFDHCQVVTEIAMWCADRVSDKVDTEMLETAALLHDIGSYPFLAAWEVRDNYRTYYPQHAMLGSKIVLDEGYDASVASIIETHVLMGLTSEEIKQAGMSLPYRDYVPSSIEGDILCYADRFHSKKPVFNSFDSFYKRLSDGLPAQARKFKELSEKFGIPDIEALAKKYGHPIK